MTEKPTTRTGGEPDPGDPMAPYYNETPEQKAERERQQAAQAELESGALNVPPTVVPDPPPPENGGGARTAKK